MAWLEITIDTAAAQVEQVAEELTKRGFSDLVIEDQQEFETFLEENRAYWDYIDEGLQKAARVVPHQAVFRGYRCKKSPASTGLRRLRRAAPDRFSAGRHQPGRELEGKLSAPGDWAEAAGAALLAGAGV